MKTVSMNGFLNHLCSRNLGTILGLFLCHLPCININIYRNIKCGKTSLKCCSVYYYITGSLGSQSTV